MTTTTDRVHNHPPYRPMCNERTTPEGRLRGACLDATTVVALATSPTPSVARGLALVAAAGDLAHRPAPVDANEVFDKLVKEVDAGRALIAMTPTGERHAAAVDALALARDVLADARDLFHPCACTAVEFTPADALGDVHVTADNIAHAPAACVRLDENGGQL